MTKPIKTPEYFVRAEDAKRFHVVMLDTEGFETAIDFASSREMAERKAARWRAKEARANSQAA